MTRRRNPAGHTGLLSNLFALANALTGFFAERFALLAQESKIALLQLLVLGACLILAVLLSLLGYIFLVASAVLGFVYITGASWVWTALVAAGVHFLMAFISLVIARSRITASYFPVTLEQLKEDREWVKNLRLTAHRTS